MTKHFFSAEQMETVFNILLASHELNKEGISVSHKAVESAVLCCAVESDLVERAGYPGPFMPEYAKQWLTFAQAYVSNDSLGPGDIAALIQKSAEPAKYKTPRILAYAREAIIAAQQSIEPSPEEDVLQVMTEHTLGDAELGTCMCNINITWTPEHQLREMRKVATINITEKENR